MFAEGVLIATLLFFTYLKNYLLLKTELTNCLDNQQSPNLSIQTIKSNVTLNEIHYYSR